MEVVEGLLGDLSGGGATDAAHRPSVHRHDPRLHVLNLGDVAGHELDSGLWEVGAGAVLDSDPADDVGELGGGSIGTLGDDDVVGGLPVEAASDVGELGGKAGGLCGLNLPAQGWLQQQVIRVGGKDRNSGKPKRILPSTSMRGLVPARMIRP